MYRPPYFFHGLFLFFLLIAFLIHLVLVIIPAFMILRKMGYSGWWVLLNYVPFGLPIGMWILATATWPVQHRAEAAAPPPAQSGSRTAAARLPG